MIQLVKARKIKRKKIARVASKRKQAQKIKFFQILKQQYLSFLWPLVILLFVVFGVTIIFQKTVFDKTNYIQHIDWSQKSIEQYDNPYLYNDLQLALTGKNVYTLNYFGFADVIAPLQQEYPILDHVKLTKTLANTVAVHLDFVKPELIFQLQKRTFWVWKWGILEIFSGNTIADPQIEKIYLPLYASGVQNIDGIFYDIPQHSLVADLKLIYQSFPQAERIVYMPWSQTTVVFVYKKKVYINHTHDVEQQIQTFYALETHYTGFQNRGVVDLGSLEEGQAIVR